MSATRATRMQYECETSDTSATRVRHECDTRATRVQHKCDTSATRTTRKRHECYTNDISATRVLHERHECDTSAIQVKNFDFDNNTGKNIFSHPSIYYILQVKDYEERINFVLRTIS